MSLIPNILVPDILRLLPSWLSLTELVRAKRVCKLWNNALVWPKKVWVLVEWWDDGGEQYEKALITVFIGQCTTVPKPSLLTPHTSLEWEWSHDYKRQWLHLSFQPNGIVKQCRERYKLPSQLKTQYHLGPLISTNQPLDLTRSQIDRYFVWQLFSDVSLKRENEYNYLALDREAKWLSIHYDSCYEYYVDFSEPYYYLYLRALPVLWEREIASWDDGCPQGYHIFKRAVEVLAIDLPKLVQQ